MEQTNKRVLAQAAKKYKLPCGELVQEIKEEFWMHPIPAIDVYSYCYGRISSANVGALTDAALKYCVKRKVLQRSPVVDKITTDKVAEIHIRASDKYVNLSRLCTSCGKH